MSTTKVRSDQGRHRHRGNSSQIFIMFWAVFCGHISISDSDSFLSLFDSYDVCCTQDVEHAIIDLFQLIVNN